jgi:tetratricopeptide (TPR) repeat protein
VAVAPALALALALGLTVPLSADRRSESKAQVDFGIELAQKQLWKEAEFRWEKAVELDPTYAAAWNNLGIAYEQQGKFEEAKKATTKPWRDRKTISSGRMPVFLRSERKSPPQSLVWRCRRRATACALPHRYRNANQASWMSRPSAS